jgi:hypothetical protein
MISDGSRATNLAQRCNPVFVIARLVGITGLMLFVVAHFQALRRYCIVFTNFRQCGNLQWHNRFGLVQSVGCFIA